MAAVSPNIRFLLITGCVSAFIAFAIGLTALCTDAWLTTGTEDTLVKVSPWRYCVTVKSASVYYCKSNSFEQAEVAIMLCGMCLGSLLLLLTGLFAVAAANGKRCPQNTALVTSLISFICVLAGTSLLYVDPRNYTQDLSKYKGLDYDHGYTVVLNWVSVVFALISFLSLILARFVKPSRDNAGIRLATSSRTSLLGTLNSLPRSTDENAYRYFYQIKRDNTSYSKQMELTTVNGTVEKVAPPTIPEESPYFYFNDLNLGSPAETDTHI